jgi:predicted nuclease of predicted toxin-antitoxin system
VKFLVDNQLPPALARFLRSDLGVEGIYVSDVGLQRASDVDLWSYSSNNGLTLASKDEDFVSLYFQDAEHWTVVGSDRRLPTRFSARCFPARLAKDSEAIR